MAIPLVDPNDAGHATAWVVFPLAFLLIFGGVAGFVLGLKRHRVVVMLSVAALIAALGYCLYGIRGLLVGSLMPLMYIYGKS